MDVSKFKEKFERVEENPLGTNPNVIKNIINFINCSKQSSDENVKYFLDNFDKMDKVFENFVIFETDNKNGFMNNFKALNLTDSSDNLAIGHEIGHVLNSIKNVSYVDIEHSVKTKVNIPENFVEILDKAKANCILPENKEVFKQYIQHLCKDSNTSEAERGPLSDIFSAVFRVPGLRIGSFENVCVFPSTHADFYNNVLPENERLEMIFDECFANIFSLKANNQEHELEIIEKLLGEDFINMYESEIEQASQIYKNEIETDKSLNVRKLGIETAEEIKDEKFLSETQNLLLKNGEEEER